jgi:hypothetical protein
MLQEKFMSLGFLLTLLLLTSITLLISSQFFLEVPKLSNEAPKSSPKLVPLNVPQNWNSAHSCLSHFVFPMGFLWWRKRERERFMEGERMYTFGDSRLEKPKEVWVRKHALCEPTPTMNHGWDMNKRLFFIVFLSRR